MKKFLLSAFAVLSAAILYADTQTEIFNRTTKYLDKGGILFQFHNTENFSEQIEKIMQLGTANSQNNANIQLGMEFFKNFTKILDLNSLQGVGVSVKKLHQSKMNLFPLYSNKSFVAIAPGSSGAVSALIKNANGSFPDAANLPANTIFASAVKLNFANAYSNIEKSFANDDSAKNIIAMFEQNIGFKMPEIMQNISGDYFLAVYKGSKADSFHFLAQIPDRNSVLKKIAQRQMAPMMKVYKDKSASIEMPMPQQSKFGSAYTILFARNKVFIYNSEAPLNKLINANKREKLLAHANPQIFGFLRKFSGNSFTVLNLDTAILDPSISGKQYQIGSVGVMLQDGYLQSGNSSFMLFDASEYFPFIKFFHKLKENDTASPAANPLQ